MVKFVDVKYLAVLLSFGLAGTLQAQLINGNFESGNLTHWTIFTTSDGNLGSYYSLPDVALFDVTGGGTATFAAQFQTGQASVETGVEEGGGIAQTFTCSAGQYSVYVDIASAFNAASNISNGSAGWFTLLMDGTAIDGLNLGLIQGGQVLRSSLEGTVSLSAGSHQVSIEMTRPYLNGGGFGHTPLQYLDNVQVTAVPEPSAILLGFAGLGGTLALRKAKVR